MLKINYLENTYSVPEIIDAYTEGSIDNFKGDTDFLRFLISYAIGSFLEGADASYYSEYADYDGTLNIMLLDSYDYLGKKLYTLYELCDKDKMRFILLTRLIGRFSVFSIIEKKLMDLNFSLKEPVPIIDEELVLSRGIKPKLNPKDYFCQFVLSFEDRDEYEYELNRSLRHRINESIKRNQDPLELLPEIPSYVEKERMEQEEKEKQRVSEDLIIPINNLYYGFAQISAGGVANINLRAISWFIYTGIDMFCYHIFKRIPDGETCLLDDNAKVHIPEQVLNKDGIEISPFSPIRSVNIATVPTIILDALKKLEEDPVTNEISILNLQSFLESIDEGSVKVKDLKELDKIVNTAYEIAYGPIFKSQMNDGERLEGTPR